MPNDEPGLPRNAYASEGFSMVGFLWKPEAALQISEGGEQVMKSDWGRGIVVVVTFLSPTIHGPTKSSVKNLEAIDRWP